MNRLAAVLFAALAAFAAAPTHPSTSTAPATPAVPGHDLGHELFYAVLEGLYRDGVDDATVDAVLKQQDGRFLHFVPGCPTCIYVLEAFRHYRARPDFVSFKTGGDTWGDGLSTSERRAFASDDVGVRLEALQRLVTDWIEQRMGRLRLTDDERAAWRDELEARSKKGMALLERMQLDGQMKHWGESRCPSCDGAVAGSKITRGR